MGSGMEMTIPIPFPEGNIPKCQAVTSSDCLSCQLSHFPKCRQELAGWGVVFCSSFLPFEPSTPGRQMVQCDQVRIWVPWMANQATLRDH